MSIQRNGTAGKKPVLCQDAVSETVTTVRSSLSYLLFTVMALQSVVGSSAYNREVR